MSKAAPITVMVLMLAAAAAGWASTPNTGSTPWDSTLDSTSASASAVTGTLKVVITEIHNADQRIVQVRNEESDEKHLVRFSEKVKLEARKRSDFGGKSKLDFDDLRPGHRLKVTYLTEDGTIVRVKVLGSVKLASKG